MKCILVSFFMGSFVIGAFAQSGYKPGFVITNKRDTIQGVIGSKDTEVCRFKKSKKDTAVSIYKPGEIKSYRFTNDRYFVTRSIGRAADVFLEVLIRGRVTLYRYKDIYFIEKGDTAFYELSIDKDMVTLYGQRIKKKSTNYIQMLSLVLADCPMINKELEDLDFKEKHLRKLIKNYHTCTGSVSVTYPEP